MLRKALKDVQAEAVKTAAALAGVGKGPKPDGDNTETEADRLKREAEQQKLETRVEALRTALATERELEQQQYEQRLADLAEFLAKRKALGEEHRINEEEAVKLRTRIEKQHMAAVKRLEGDRVKTFLASRRQEIGAAQSTGRSLITVANAIFGESKAGAIVNTAQAVTATLAQYGATPWGFAAAAAAAAAGAAQIATIRSTSRGGGGSAAPVSVGGTGAGATTSAPAQAPAGDPGPGQTLYVEGINADDLFSGDRVRFLAELLLDHERDGGRVVLAR